MNRGRLTLTASAVSGNYAGEGGFGLTVTGSTKRPIQFSFASIPRVDELRDTILQRISDMLYHDDIHGNPVWRKHMTLRLAEEIRAELQGPARP